MKPNLQTASLYKMSITFSDMLISLFIKTWMICHAENLESNHEKYNGRAIFSLLPFRPWMGLIVHIGEVLEIEMGVNLCGGEVAMSEQFLHCA